MGWWCNEFRAILPPGLSYQGTGQFQAHDTLLVVFSFLSAPGESGETTFTGKKQDRNNVYTLC